MKTIYKVVKPIKRLTLSLAILLITRTYCFSQQNLKEGYIIDLNNDTIYGYIDYRGNIFNSSKCIFYNHLKSEPIIYKPREIISYRFLEGKYYISKLIKTISGDTTMFLEYLVKGITSLYYLNDRHGEHYFIEKDNEMIELTNKIFEVTAQNKVYYKESNKYKGVLIYAYSGTDAVIPYINDASFSRKSMIKLSKQYHDLVCKDQECIIYENKEPSIHFSAGPVFGFEYVRKKYEELIPRFHSFDSKSILLGVALNFKLLFINDKLNFEIKTFFEKCKFTGMTGFWGGSSNIYYRYSLEEDLLHFNFNFKYEYPRGNFRPTASLGPKIVFYVNQKSTYNKQNDFINHNYDLCGVGTIGLVNYLKKKSLFIDLYYMNGKGLLHGNSKLNLDSINIYNLSSFGIITGILF